MPRPCHSDEAAGLYHFLNGRILRAKLFYEDADFEAFERIADIARRAADSSD